MADRQLLELGLGCSIPVKVSDSPTVLRLAMAGSRRGSLVFDMRIIASLPEETANLYIAVSKSGHAPDPTRADRHWLSDSFPQGVSGWRCRILMSQWRTWGETPVAWIGISRNALPAPLWYPWYRNRCVSFEALPDQSPVDVESCLVEVSLNFESEAEQQPEELKAAHAAYYACYGSIPGRQIAEEGKMELGREDDDELAYGEVELLSFWEMLRELVAPQPGETFLDLGSGTGRAVIAAALGLPTLNRCLGIELVPSLHQAAIHVTDCIQASGCSVAPVEFRLADFANISWEKEADIIWVSSFCMSRETMAEIQCRATQLRSGSRIVTMEADFGEGVPELEQVLIGSKNHGRIVEMSFGEPQVYVMRRI